MKQETVNASSSGQAMEVDDESKKAVSEPVVTVDATTMWQKRKKERRTWKGKRLWE